MTGTARALQFVAPREVAIVDVPLPAVGAGEVLMRTEFSGISAGTEMLAYRGEIDPELPLDESLGTLGGTFTYPFRYGYSAVGTVERGSEAIPEGTLAFCFHPHQDRFVVPGSAIVPLRDVQPRPATLLPMVETALQVTLDAGAVVDERVVVFGLGTIGLLTCLLLTRARARVLGVDPLDWRRAAAAAVGLDVVAPERLAATLEHERAAVPLVIEASGNPTVLADALRLLAHEGTALVVSWYGTASVPLPLGAAFHRRRLTIRSSQVSSIPASQQARWTVDRRRAVARELLAELPLDALATLTVAFERAAEAYAALDARRPGLIHVALGYS